MKRLFLMISLLFLLTACGKQEETAPVVPEAPPVEEVTELPEEPAPVEEIPMEIVTPEEDTPAAETEAEAVPAPFTFETADGLIEDTVGYLFVIPTFEVAGADAIREYYVELTDHLADYTKETVYTEAASRGCIVSVYGEVTEAVLQGDVLTVTYVYRCEFSDTEQPTANVRTDSFRAATGEKVEN